MFSGLVRASVPLFLSMVTNLLGAVVVTAVLGRHATVTLAAFAVMTAVLTPASTAVAGALRGLAPFVAPHRDDPDAVLPVLRDARWLSLFVGMAGALAVLGVPALAGAAGVPAEVVAELGMLPWLLALYLVIYSAGGGATAVLVAIGRSRGVLWASLASTAVMIVLAVALVPPLGLTGVGVAWTLSGLTLVGVGDLALRRALGRPVGRGRPRPREIARLAAVSLPLAATVLIKFGALGVITFAAGVTGARDAAAHAVLATLTGFIVLAAMAVGQASVPEVSRAATVASARRANRVAALLALGGTTLAALALLALGGPVLGLFTGDPAVRAVALALLPLMLLSSMADSVQAVQGFGLTGLKRTGASLAYFAAGYGLLALAAVPVAATWGVTGLWVAMLVGNLLLAVLQATGFHRHSAQVGGAGRAAAGRLGGRCRTNG
ncbi:MATE family efflux transporter [Nonomuraea sp. NPDC050478]|uniref:MATE family efflux transporter n=1 Tax=Nonomuraea sp. NPDC050478 TaxID=3364365 RepID=UPI003797455D